MEYVTKIVELKFFMWINKFGYGQPWLKKLAVTLTSMS